jgi:hypothetical protein
MGAHASSVRTIEITTASTVLTGSADDLMKVWKVSVAKSSK